MPTHEQWLDIIRESTGVKDLRYRVYHERVYNDPLGIEDSVSLSPRGGRTRVELGYNEYKEVEQVGVKVNVWHPVAGGHADTHPLDNYNRKVGRDIALRRALDAFREGKETVT